jgi:hypothetical protein
MIAAIRLTFIHIGIKTAAPKIIIDGQTNLENKKWYILDRILPNSLKASFEIIAIW